MDLLMLFVALGACVAFGVSERRKIEKNAIERHEAEKRWRELRGIPSSRPAKEEFYRNLRTHPHRTSDSAASDHVPRQNGKEMVGFFNREIFEEVR